MVVNMIKAEVVLDTIWNGKRITTLQLRLPRFILAQLNTHRVISKSTASSRAIPTSKLLEMVKNDAVQPVYWGKNQAGMQASEEVDAETKEKALQEWRLAALNASKTAEKLLELGLHKQIANRILEPFMWAETIVTATEWDNFFKLRLHEDSQPEIQELARCMKEAMDNSEPVKSKIHLPYITLDEMEDYVQGSIAVDSESLNEDLYRYFVPISAARCARVSYLNHDQSNPVIEKDLATAEKLLSAGHWSPFEHQAYALPEVVPCRNFIGWKQARTLYEN